MIGLEAGWIVEQLGSAGCFVGKEFGMAVETSLGGGYSWNTGTYLHAHCQARYSKRAIDTGFFLND